jgi:hypothetical protein
MKAICEFEVVDMLVTVAVDSKGESVHKAGPAESRSRSSTSARRRVSMSEANRTVIIRKNRTWPLFQSCFEPFKTGAVRLTS